MGDHTGMTPNQDVAIFWDYENVHIPARCSSPLRACTEIVKAASKYGRIQQRRVYSDYSRDDSNVAWWSADIGESGFDLVSTPRRGSTKSKETLDRKMINDIIFFAWDVLFRGGRPCVILITSDGDFAYTINKLRDRGASNVVIHGRNASNLLIESADVALNMEQDVLSESILQPPRRLAGPPGFQVEKLPSTGYENNVVGVPTGDVVRGKNAKETGLLDDLVMLPPVEKRKSSLSTSPCSPLTSSSDLSRSISDTLDETNTSKEEKIPSTALSSGVPHTAAHTFQDALALCKALASSDKEWELSSIAGENFREALVGMGNTSCDQKTRFRLARAKVVGEGWVMQGRQMEFPDGRRGEVVSTPPSSSNLQGFSKHQYLRITDAGMAQLKVPSAPASIAELNAPNTLVAKEDQRALETSPYAEKLKTSDQIMDTESSTSSARSEQHWQEVRGKVAKQRSLVEKDVTACLFIKNVPSRVSVDELSSFIEKEYSVTVLQAAAKELSFSSPFYFVRVVLESSQQAASLLRVAQNQQFKLFGRVMSAAYDRWPATKYADAAPRLSLGGPSSNTALYIENLPNGIDIQVFVLDIERRLSVSFKRAIIAEGAKPYDVFWNAHVEMKAFTDAEKLLRVGAKHKDRTSKLLYDGRFIWVKSDSHPPQWSDMHQHPSNSFYRPATWAQAAK